MPTKTSVKTPNRPGRSASTPGAGGRFSRSTPSPASAGRFGRSTPSPSGGARFGLSSSGTSPKKRPTRGTSVKPKSKKGKSGGGLSGLLSSLPAAGLAKKASPKSSGSKAKPALALIAAGAGAFLGRKQLQKRNENDVVPVTTVNPTPTSLNDTPPQPAAPRPVDSPSSPDAL
jgi:hypothetical protein